MLVLVLVTSVVLVPPAGLLETGEPLFGRYLIPVEGQVDVEPSGLAATKVPVCTEPRTSKWYQISLRAPELQPRVTEKPPRLAPSAVWICAEV